MKNERWQLARTFIGTTKSIIEKINIRKMSYSVNDVFMEYWYEFARDKGMSEEEAITFAEDKFEELS
jgi:hypothetical protein